MQDWHAWHEHCSFYWKAEGLRGPVLSSSCFLLKCYTVVYPLPDSQSLPTWGLFHCSISTKIPGFQCISHTVPPQPKQAPCKCACRWHPCPFQQGIWKTAHPLGNLSQGFFFFFGSSFHSYLQLGKDWGYNPCAVCKPGAGMRKCKGKFLEQHSWWLLLCHGEKSLTSPTDTQSFTCFRYTSFLGHSFPIVLSFPWETWAGAWGNRNSSPWSWRIATPM